MYTQKNQKYMLWKGMNRGHQSNLFRNYSRGGGDEVTSEGHDPVVQKSSMFPSARASSPDAAYAMTTTTTGSRHETPVANADVNLLRRFRDELFSHPSPTIAQSFEVDSIDGYNENSCSDDYNNSNRHSNGSDGYDYDDSDASAISRLLARQLSTLREIRSQQELKDELIHTLKERVLVLEQDQCYSNNIISDLKREVVILKDSLNLNSSLKASEEPLGEKSLLPIQLEKLQKNVSELTECLSIEKENAVSISRERDAITRERDAVKVELFNCKYQMEKIVKEQSDFDATMGGCVYNAQGSGILISSIISELSSDFKMISSCISKDESENSSDHNSRSNDSSRSSISGDKNRIFAGSKNLKSNILLIHSKLDSYACKLRQDINAPDYLLSFLASQMYFIELFLGQNSYVEDLKSQMKASNEAIARHIKTNEKYSLKISSMRNLSSFVKKVIPKHLQSMLSCGIIDREGSDVVLDLNSADISGVFPDNKAAKGVDYLHNFQVFENGIGILLERYAKFVLDSTDTISKLKSLQQDKVAEMKLLHEKQVSSMRNDYEGGLEAERLVSSRKLKSISKATELELREQIKKIKFEYSSKLSSKLSDIEGLVREQNLKYESHASSLSQCLYMLMKYVLKVQGRYQSVSFEKAITSRICKGLTLLKNNVALLSHACVKKEVEFCVSQSGERPNRDNRCDQSNISQGRHVYERFSEFNFKATGYPIKRTLRRYCIPTIRIIALAVIAGNRFLRSISKRTFNNSTWNVPDIPDISQRQVKPVDEWSLPTLEEIEGKSEEDFFPILLNGLTTSSQGKSSTILHGIRASHRHTSGRSTYKSTRSGVIRDRYGRNGDSNRVLWDRNDPVFVDIYGKVAFSKVQDTLLSISKKCNQYSCDITDREKKFSVLTSSMKAKIQELQDVVSQQTYTISKQSTQIEKYEQLQINSTEQVIKLMKETVIGNPIPDMGVEKGLIAETTNDKENAMNDKLKSARDKYIDNPDTGTHTSTTGSMEGKALKGPSWVLLSRNTSADSSHKSEDSDLYSKLVVANCQNEKDASIALNSFSNITSNAPANIGEFGKKTNKNTTASAIASTNNRSRNNNITLTTTTKKSSISTATTNDKYLADEASRIDGNVSDSYDDSLYIMETYSQVSKLTESLRISHGI